MLQKISKLFYILAISHFFLLHCKWACIFKKQYLIISMRGSYTDFILSFIYVDNFLILHETDYTLLLYIYLKKKSFRIF